MKRTYKILAGLLIAAGIGGLAHAQAGRGAPGWGCDGMGPMGAGPMGPRGMRAGMRMDPSLHAERRLTFLKDQLKITAEQEPLWQAFAEKTKAEAGKGLQAMRAQAADASLTAPERMAKMQQLMKARVDAMAGVADSFNRLYGVLTPDQQKVADQTAAQMGRGMGGRMGYGPGRMMPPPPAPAAPPQG